MLLQGSGGGPGPAASCLVRHAAPLQSLPPGGGQLKDPRRWSLEFSAGPMERSSVAAGSKPEPEPIPFSPAGPVQPPVFAVAAGRRAESMARLVLELNPVRDRRGLALAGGRWRWIPAPTCLAVVPVNGGERGTGAPSTMAAWTPLTPVWPSNRPELRTHGRRLGGLGLVSPRMLEANHPRSGGCRSAQETLVALPGSLQPVGAGTLQPFGGPPLRFASSAATAWRTAGAGMRPAARQRLSWSWGERGGGAPFCENRKQRAGGPCSPRAGAS